MKNLDWDYVLTKLLLMTLIVCISTCTIQESKHIHELELRKLEVEQLKLVK